MKLLFLLRPLYLATLLLVTLGQCKTLRGKDVPEKEGRRIENFVDFKGEGDQLAVESTSTEDLDNVAPTSKLTGGRRKILGMRKVVIAPTEGTNEKTDVTEASRQCANVNKVFYPIVPVIIASIIGLVGAVIISAIARGVFGLIKGGHNDMGGSGYGYERRLYESFPNLFGFDMSKIDYLGLTKRIFRAIEKVY